MQVRQHFAIHAGLWAVCLAAAPWVYGAQDKIVLKRARSQETIKGEIREETLERFKMVEPGGTPMPDFAGNQIADIQWDIQDFEYMRAMAEYEKGNFAAAATSFKVCFDNVNIRKAASAYLGYMSGDSYRRASKPKEAEAILDKVIEEYPKSWYAPRAIDCLIDVCVTSGNIQKVRALVTEIRKLGGKYPAKAILYEGRMLLLTKNYDEAMAKFNEAVRGSSDAEIQGQARMLIAQCQVFKKDYAGAKQTAEQVLTTEAPDSVFAAAHLVIGNALHQQAMEKKGEEAQELFLDAVLEYLRVWTLYPGDERQEGEALYKAGESFMYLGRLPGRSRDRRRSAEMFAQVRSKFPGSYWAKQAEKAMAGGK